MRSGCKELEMLTSPLGKAGLTERERARREPRDGKQPIWECYVDQARVSQLLGVPPVVIHSTMSLSNWRLRDPAGSFTLDNLTTIHSFDSTRDLEVDSMKSV